MTVTDYSADIVESIRNVCDDFTDPPYSADGECMCTTCGEALGFHWVKALWQERRLRIDSTM